MRRFNNSRKVGPWSSRDEGGRPAGESMCATGQWEGFKMGLRPGSAPRPNGARKHVFFGLAGASFGKREQV